MSDFDQRKFRIITEVQNHVDTTNHQHIWNKVLGCHRCNNLIGLYTLNELERNTRILMENGISSDNANKISQEQYDINDEIIRRLSD